MRWLAEYPPSSPRDARVRCIARGERTARDAPCADFRTDESHPYHLETESRRALSLRARCSGWGARMAHRLNKRLRRHGPASPIVITRARLRRPSRSATPSCMSCRIIDITPQAWPATASGEARRVVDGTVLRRLHCARQAPTKRRAGDAGANMASARRLEDARPDRAERSAGMRHERGTPAMWHRRDDGAPKRTASGDAEAVF